MEKETIEESKFKRRQKIPQEIRKKWEKQQAFIKSKIIEQDEFVCKEEDLTYIAGVDVSFSGKYQNGACAGLLIYHLKNRKIVYEEYEYVVLNQQYIPGFLAFRQLPPTLQLFRKLKEKKPQYWPQLIIVDGNGILHKNGCGYASHLGVILDIPTIGCAKTFFDIDGLHQHQIEEKCAQNMTYYGQYEIIKGKSNRQWCAAVMTDPNQGKAIFLSIGTKISLKTALGLCLKMLKYQIPQPVRLCDKNSRKMIKKMTEQDYKSAKSYNMIFLSKQQ